MNSRILISVIFLSILFCGTLSSQNFLEPTPVLPLKATTVPMFGKDIVIRDRIDQNQKTVAVCSAFNGWLFSAFTFIKEKENWTNILRSIDNGITWELIREGSLPFPRTRMIEIDLIATGNDLDNLKLFGCFIGYDTIEKINHNAVARFNGISGDFEIQISLPSNTRDIAIASDCNFPALNSNPNSFAIIYSRSHIVLTDTIAFICSSDGGTVFDTHRVLDYTEEGHFDKVDLSYGYSPTLNTGRYYAAWEKKFTQSSAFGSIYTAHSEPAYNSPFTPAECLDCSDPSIYKKLRNPVIATQYGNAENDSLNLTEIILSEKQSSKNESVDIAGFYNLQSTATGYFRPLTINGSQDGRTQPDMFYNPYDSTFNVTYFNSSESQLPYLVNNMNLSTPDSWNVISSGYNDSINISDPQPKCRLNFSDHYGIFAWCSVGSDGRGIAMFDAANSIYNYISENNKSLDDLNLHAYPNPCSNETAIWFDLPKQEMVTFKVYSILGNPISNEVHQLFSPGINNIRIDLSSSPPGTYLYSFQVKEYCATGKIIVVK